MFGSGVLDYEDTPPSIVGTEYDGNSQRSSLASNITEIHFPEQSAPLINTQDDDVTKDPISPVSYPVCTIQPTQLVYQLHI